MSFLYSLTKSFYLSINFLFVTTIIVFNSCTESEEPKTEKTLPDGICQADAFPNLLYQDNYVFPSDKSLKRPEDGKALPDGRIVVSDSEVGLRIVNPDGSSTAFGHFTELGYNENPELPGRANGMFLEGDKQHILVGDVYSGKIYRVNVESQETKIIHNHPFGVNSVYRDKGGSIWFTQSTNNTKEEPEILYRSINRPEPTGALYRLSYKDNEEIGFLEIMIDSIYFANGLVMDKAESHLYFAETMMDRIWRCKVDNNSGEISEPEIFHTVLTPDNLIMDKNDNLHIASPMTNTVFVIDSKCQGLHTLFSAPSSSNHRMQSEWIRRSHLGEPLLELFNAELSSPLSGALTGMFWSEDEETFYATGLGDAILKVSVGF